MKKNEVRLEVFRFLESFDTNIRTKFDNICSKTGQYNVPNELFQKRTHRKNRVLISWKVVKKNKLTIKQLSSFSGGVAVEFINEDFFDENNQNDPTFLALKDKIGSDDIVSAIITIRSESGNSSSAIQREYFKKLINNTEIVYKGKKVILNKDNYMKYAIKQIDTGGIGNEKWEGFLYISIKGGQQDTIESHTDEQTIFNPACEFANESVCEDINLVMSYFALISVDTSKLDDEKRREYNKLMTKLKDVLKKTYYNSDSYTGNLLDYCDNHPSTKIVDKKLYDPIQVEQINIEDFAINNKQDPHNLDFTHDEAVFYEKYYWDEAKDCILSPARPTNVFWSKHLSNMMQQNFSLEEYFRHEEEIVSRRKSILNK